MQRVLAIAGLTWKSALRYRLLWVLGAALLGSVVVLPLVLKGDGTARGLVQILLTYTLSVTTFLLGLATLWLSCGSLARDIDECQMQMVAVKPIARWQVWLGKWLGILAINTVLLSFAGVSIYVLLQWRASRLTPIQQKVLKDDVLVARAVVKPLPLDIQGEIRRRYEEIPNREQLSEENRMEALKRLAAQVDRDAQIVPPRQTRGWEFNLGWSARLRSPGPLSVRVKFYAANTNNAGLYEGVWQFAKPNSDTRFDLLPMRLAPDSYQEFKVSSELADAQGRLFVYFESREDIALLFPLEDGVEILYRDGGFALNFARGLGILLAWMGLLSALGLAAASVTSFPVAAFVSISLLLVAFSSSTLTESVSNQNVIGGRPDEFQTLRPVLNTLLLPLFKGILAIIHVVDVASPIDSLSTGRSITWSLLTAAWVQVVVLAGGILGGVGAWLFSRRELATAQGVH